MEIAIIFENNLFNHLRYSIVPYCFLFLLLSLWYQNKIMLSACGSFEQCKK